jgi:hypothetical protein
MATLISGGRKGGGISTQPNLSSSVRNQFPITNEPQRKPVRQDDEGWGDYLKSAGARLPANIFKLAHTGGGLANIMHALSKEAPKLAEGLFSAASPAYSGLKYLSQYAPEKIKNYIPNVESITEFFAEPGAQRHAEALFPQIMTEQKPGDEYIDLMLAELAMSPLIGGPRALTSLAGIGKTAARGLGHLAGGTLGGSAGKYLGEKAGMPETGKELGILAGTVGGGQLAERIPGALYERANLRRNIEKKGIREDISQYEKELSAQKDIVENTRREKRAARRKLAQEEGELLSAKESLISEEEARATKLENEVDKLRALEEKEYLAAEESMKGKRGHTQILSDYLTDAWDRIFKGGLDETEQSQLKHLLLDADRIMRSSENQISLEDARLIQKRINDKIYNKNVTESVKTELRIFSKALDEFIKEWGGDDLKKHWDKAKSSTKRRYDILNKELPAVEKSIKDTTKKVGREKISPERINDLKDIADTAKITYDEAVRINNNIEKKLSSSTEKLLKADKKPPAGTLDILSQILKKLDPKGAFMTAGFLKYLDMSNPVNASISGLISVAPLALDEMSFISQAMKEHPDLTRNMSGLFDKMFKARPRDIPAIANQINQVAKKMDIPDRSYSVKTQDQEALNKKSRIISGGRK